MSNATSDHGRSLLFDELRIVGPEVLAIHRFANGIHESCGCCEVWSGFEFKWD